jgi:photosystem II stability/assembly factor-like uncharacterized protein
MMQNSVKSLFQVMAVGLLLARSVCVAQTPVWSQFPNSPAGTTRNDDIHFVNITNGWSARGTDGIYRTTNGGNTWTKVYTNTTSVAHFRAISFASTARGWAGNLAPGSYDGTVTDTNMLYETFDGGTTWNPVAAINASGMQGFCAMHVMNTQYIYGVGRVRGPAYFAKTENGGSTWWVTNLTAAGVMGGLMDVYFKDSTNGFIVGMNTNLFASPPYYGSIARTTNGGLTWQVLVTTTVTNSYFWKMSWPSPNIGYCSLQQNGAAGTVIFYKTTDGGATWVSNGIPNTALGVASTTTWFLQSIGFVSTNEGWMGGSTSGALTFSQNFIHTTNGGVTWTTEGYDNTRGMNRIRFLNPNFGYASGQKLHIFRVPLGINSQPTNQTVVSGANAPFFLTAQGYAPLTYQWRFNGTNIIGATASNYTVVNAQVANAGNYDVVVNDYSGSVTSSAATLAISELPVAPNITSQPQSLSVNPGNNATFNVTASGTAPLRYQWQFNNVNISSATNASFTRTNVQPVDLGNYFVVITNTAGSVTSAPAMLAFNFTDDFDGYISPVTVTNIGTTNGYKIFFNAASGGLDFKAIFGFNYSTVTYPTNIISAPNSVGGSTKGLYLTVNKDATSAAAAVNFYPTNQTLSGNYSLKFDVWMNWANGAVSTESLLFGINHSGNVTNQVSLATSDGLFFAMNAEGGSTSSSGTLRDFSAFRGGGAGAAPILMLTNNTTFGPTPLLAPQFDNSNPGFTNLFPAKTISGWATNVGVGTPGNGWVQVEVRQVNNLITWLLNGTAVAQYTNTYGYTNGSILIGYNDTFSSIGDTNSFAVLDNIRVEPYPVTSPVLVVGQPNGGNFNFSFASQAYDSYTVQYCTNLAAPTWLAYTNLVGNGSNLNLSVPIGATRYFRVSQP